MDLWSGCAYGEHRVFRQPHWPMVHAEATLAHALNVHGLPFSLEEAEEKVKCLLICMYDAVCTHLNIGRINDHLTLLPNHEPLWRRLRQFNFQDGDIGALTRDVMRSMCDVPENVEHARIWRYDNVLVPSFPRTLYAAMMLLIPNEIYDPLLHDPGTVALLISMFQRQQQRFLARQRRLPIAYRVLRKRTLLPPAECWIDIALSMLPDNIVPAARQVLTGECNSWTKALDNTAGIY